MSIYQYKARDKKGKLVSGTMVANSSDDVARKLIQAENTPVEIKERVVEKQLRSVFDRLSKVSLTEINLFTRQFATLQRAGVDILKSIRAIREQTQNQKFVKVLEEVENSVNQGDTLSIALKPYTNIFGSLYLSIISSGEETGKLADSLERLAAIGEHQERIVRQVKTAMRYPMMVVCAIAIAFVILTLFVIPRFVKVYSAAGVTLPIPTKILIWAHSALSQWWWVTGIVVIICGIFIRRFFNSSLGKKFWDKLILRIPVFGELINKVTMARFCRVTGNLFRSGIPILRILELASVSVGNLVVEDRVKQIRLDVSEGMSLSQAIRKTKQFPSVVEQMVVVGEDTGKVDELLLHIADYYDQQIAYMIENFNSLIEPILLLILGSAVLLMALGIFLPMWNLMELFKV